MGCYNVDRDGAHPTKAACHDFSVQGATRKPGATRKAGAHNLRTATYNTLYNTGILLCNKMDMSHQHLTQVSYSTCLLC